MLDVEYFQIPKFLIKFKNFFSTFPVGDFSHYEPVPRKKVGLLIRNFRTVKVPHFL